MSLPDLLATPRDTDLAWSIVTTVLPMGGEETAFSVGLGVLAAGLVFLATLWLGWWIVSGITQAAYSGKPFAEGMHGIWAPLRIVVGFGMLVPAVGGLPAVEYVLRDLVVRPGVNLANAVALRSAEFVVKDGHLLSPISIGGAGLVRDIVESEVCAAAVLAGRDNAADTSRPSASLPSPAGSPVVRPAKEAWWPWGESTPAATTGFSWSWGSACGSLSVSSAGEYGDGSFGEVRRQAISRVISETRAMPFVKALADAVRGLGADSALPTDAALDVARQQGQLRDALAAEFKRAGGIYDRAIASAAADVAKASTDRATLRAEVLRDIEERGFMALASYYRVLAAVSLATAEAAAERPVRVGPDPKAWGVYEGEASRALAFLDTQFRRESAAEVLASGEIGEATAEATNLFGDMLSATTDPLRDYLLSYDGFRPDPIADLADIGGRLLVGSEAGYAIVLAAYGTSSLFMGGGQGALDAVMVPGWPLLGSLYVVGAVLAYVMPSIPYYLMWFAFGAFTLEFATASIAVLAWAFSHVRPDGQEFVSRAQRHGYGQLLVGLFMRLPATVLAFIVGQMVLVTLLNGFLASYSVSVQGNAFGRAMGVTGLVVSFGMMLYIQWQLILWSFKLITSIPERLGAWFGISVSSWGEGEAGTQVVGGVWSSQRNLPGTPKPGGGKGGSEDRRGAKDGTPLGASQGEAPPLTPSS